MLHKRHLAALALLATFLFTSFILLTANILPIESSTTVPTLAQLPTAEEAALVQPHQVSNHHTLTSQPQPATIANITAESVVSLPTSHPIQLDEEEADRASSGVTATETSTLELTVIPADTGLLTAPTVDSIPISTFTPQNLILPPPPPDAVPNAQLITLAENITESQREALIEHVEANGGEVVQTIDGINALVMVAPSAALQEAITEFSVVVETEPDYYVSALAQIPPSDPLYPDQWALPVIGAPEAWQALPADAPQIIVAVIDSGICANHPDLQGRVLVGYDFIELDQMPQDAFGHGCGVSGIIAANVDDGIGIAGVAPNTMILPLRVLDAQGLGKYSDVAAAIVYAADSGARVINLSLGGINASSVLEQAVQYAIDRGVTIVAAAGNTGQSVLYPAAYDPVISVGSIDRNLERSSFSPTTAVDIVAPGREILSLKPDGSYTTMSGTSYAAPQVAAVSALEMAYGRMLDLQTGIVRFNLPIPTDSATPTVAPETLSGELSADTAPTTSKPDSNLSSALQALASTWDRNQVQALEAGQVSGLEISGERVAVTITTTDAGAAGAVKARIISLGGEIAAEYDRWFDALVPISALTEVGSLSGVVLVQPIVRVFPAEDATPDGSSASDEIRSLAGSHLTQGVAVSNANIWHSAGITGTEVTVAVMDCGFSNVPTLQSLGELPPAGRLTTLGTIPSCAHGSGVAEIVYDMAPGINMILVAPNSGLQMAQRIQELANYPAESRPKVITSSIGYYSLESGDGTGPVSNAIAYAVSQGVLFTQAAGNQAQYNWQNTFTDADADGWMEFSLGVEINQLGYLPSGYPLQLYLRWSGWPTTNQDYDFYIFRYNQADSIWEIAAASEIAQTGSQPPTESIYHVTAQEAYYGIAVYKYSATGSQIIDIMGHNAPTFQYGTPERSLVDPATSTSVFAVAALNRTSPFSLESYSSQGPALGSGGSLGTGNSQPRIAGFANVDTWTYGLGIFNGTSSATPHVAGAAALVWQAYPAYSVPQVKSFLEARSIDMGTSGYDVVYGMGRLHLGALPIPTITTHPQSQTISSGGTATLNVMATGTAPLTYQWYRGAAPDTSSPVGANSSSFTTPALTTTTSYWVRVSNSAGSANSTTATITVGSGNANLIQNGDFSSAMSYWLTYGNISQRLNGGVFEFYHNTTLGSTRPSILQQIPTAIPNGTPLEFRVDMGNSGPTRKRALIFIVNNDWSDLQTCSFWIPANTPLRTYVLQGRPTTNWSSAQVAIYANPADNTGWLQVDNASLTLLPNNLNETRCIDPGAPAPGSGSDSGNLILNGGFSAGITNWLSYGSITQRLNSGLFEFYHNTALGSVRPSVLQNTNAALPANAPLELQLQLGNSGPTRKRALIILFEHNWSDLQICSFWIPPYSSLQNYALQTHTTTAWSNVSVAVYANPADSTGWLQVDNVSLRHRPSLGLSGTTCYEPGALMTSLAANADEVLPTLIPTSTASMTATMPVIIPTSTSTATMEASASATSSIEPTETEVEPVMTVEATADITETAEVTATPFPTEEPTVTNTAELPTETAISPTPTETPAPPSPAPTETPQPTATPMPTADTAPTNTPSEAEAEISGGG